MPVLVIISLLRKQANFFGPLCMFYITWFAPPQLWGKQILRSGNGQSEQSDLPNRRSFAPALRQFIEHRIWHQINVETMSAFEVTPDQCFVANARDLIAIS